MCEHRPEGLGSYSLGLRVAVVLVKVGENEAQAWQRHVTENPGDRTADIRIFHYDTKVAPKCAALSKEGQEHGTRRDLTGV